VGLEGGGIGRVVDNDGKLDCPAPDDNGAGGVATKTTIDAGPGPVRHALISAQILLAPYCAGEAPALYWPPATRTRAPSSLSGYVFLSNLISKALPSEGVNIIVLRPLRVLVHRRPANALQLLK